MMMMMTEISGFASSSWRATETSVTAAAPWTATSRISNWTDGQRLLAFSTTSFSASEFRPQIRPTLFGKNGSSFLRSAAKSPSDASWSLRSSRRASNSPTPTCLISLTLIESEPLLAYQETFEYITTRAFAGRGFTASRTDLWHMMDRLISALVSRSLIKTICAPGRTVTSDSSPSIQTGPNLLR